MIVPAGSYQIGLTAQSAEELASLLAGTQIKPDYLNACIPRHEISIGRFEMSDEPVTCGEYRSFVEKTGYATLAEREGWGWVWERKWLRREGVSWRVPFGTAADREYILAEDRLPVMQISWQDAVAYCDWFSAINNTRTRLPDEGEWEVFAAISGLPGAETAVSLFEMPEVVRGDSLGYVRALSGMSGAAFRSGIVWEWTSSWYASYPGGKHYRDFGTTYRVLRGGSAASAGVQKIREFRLRKCPTARSPYYGFRALTECSS